MNINQIIKRYNNTIHQVAKRYFQSDADIDDIKQEVFIKTWKKYDQCKDKNKFSSWVSTIAANTCKDKLRSNRNTLANHEDYDNILANLPDNSISPEKAIIMTERQKLILDSIEKLKPKLKDVLILFDIEELTYEEIAQKLDCPIGTVKSRLFNARKALKQELQELI